MQNRFLLPGPIGALRGIMNGETGWPIVILCHGLISTKQASSMVAIEKVLISHNIATCRFDFFGHGESDGNISDLTISKCIQNTNDIIEYVKQRGFETLGIVGSSLSGFSSTIVASQRSDLAVMALKCPLFDYQAKQCSKLGDETIKEWKDAGSLLLYPEVNISIKYKYYEDYGNYDAYSAAESVNIPVLLVHGDSDVSVPIEQSIKAQKLFPQCTLKIIRGADHGFDTVEQFDEMVHTMSTFLIKHLNPSNS